MAELHTATAVTTGELLGTLEIPARRASSTGLRKLTLDQIKDYCKATGLLTLQGNTDCSGNPNYPSALKGDVYYVSVAGKIGGASGKTVDVGDAYIASADNAGGTEASVGASWFVLEHNLVSALTGAIATIAEMFTGTDNTKLLTPATLVALWKQGVDVASAATVTFGDGGYFNVTGTTTITALAFTNDHSGRMVWVKFAGALTLTHNATSLILPTGANIATAAGDTALFVSEGSGNFRCLSYRRADGTALVASSASLSRQAVTSSATVTPAATNDVVDITAQAVGLTLANWSGSPQDGWGMMVRIKDNGSAQTIAFGTKYRAMGTTLPTSTVAGKWMILGMEYNGTDDKYDVTSVINQA